MLGAVKDEGPEQVRMFRVLARRWKSLAPAKRERAALSSTSSADETPKAARAWIEKPRHVYAPEKIKEPSRGWNPWLWVK